MLKYFLFSFFFEWAACCCFWHDQIHLPHARIDHARCTFVLLSTNARPSACVTHSKLRQQTATSIRVEKISLVVIFLLQYIFRGCAQNILPPMCSPPPHHPPHPPQPHYLRLGLCAPPPLSLNRHSIKAVQRPLSKYFSFLAPLPLTKIKLLRIPSFFPPTAIFLNRLNQQNKKGKPHSSTTWTRPSRTIRYESYESESLIICCSLVA